MRKLPMLSLTVLAALTMAGAPSMDSQAAGVRVAYIPVGSSHGGNGGNCSNPLGNLIGGQLSGIHFPGCGQNDTSCRFGSDCQNGFGCQGGNDCWQNNQIKPNYPGNGQDIPAVPGGDQNMPELPGGGQNRPSAPDVDENDGSFAARVVELVNEERAKAGIAPLSLDRSAMNAAEVRAGEIQTSFSHTRPDGRNFNTALAEAGVRFSGAGENIAYGQRSPEEVMNTWMNSSGHRANILNRSYTSMGAGYVQSASGTGYWTQLFFN